MFHVIRKICCTCDLLLPVILFVISDIVAKAFVWTCKSVFTTLFQQKYLIERNTGSRTKSTFNVFRKRLYVLVGQYIYSTSVVSFALFIISISIVRCIPNNSRLPLCAQRRILFYLIFIQRNKIYILLFLFIHYYY